MELSRLDGIRIQTLYIRNNPVLFGHNLWRNGGNSTLHPFSRVRFRPKQQLVAAVNRVLRRTGGKHPLKQLHRVFFAMHQGNGVHVDKVCARRRHKRRVGTLCRGFRRLDKISRHHCWIYCLLGLFALVKRNTKKNTNLLRSLLRPTVVIATNIGFCFGKSTMSTRGKVGKLLITGTHRQVSKLVHPKQRLHSGTQEFTGWSKTGPPAQRPDPERPCLARLQMHTPEPIQPLSRPFVL